MNKRLIAIAPLLALAILWALIYQSLHRFEHATAVEEEHHACCHVHHLPSTEHDDNSNIVVLSEKSDLSHCILCEFEFFFVQSKFISYCNSVLNLPDIGIPLINECLHQSYKGQNKMLRAPPFA
jgi:hypothetical protein